MATRTTSLSVKHSLFAACIILTLVLLIFLYRTDYFYIHCCSQTDNAALADEQSWTKSGRAELEQLDYFWYKCNRTYPQEKANVHTNGTRSYMINFIMRNTGNPYITIQEYFDSTTGERHKISSGGGSNFRVEIVGDHETHTCSLRDHLNGTYTGLCPRIYTCVNGTVFLDYVNFEAFRHHHGGHWPGRIHRQLHSGQLCPLRVTHITTRNGSTDAVCARKNAYDYIKGRWWKVTGDWAWGTEDGCILPFMSGEELKRCYYNKRSIRILGDSHVQNMGTYLRQELQKADENLDFSRFTIASAPYPPLSKKLINIIVSNVSEPFAADDILLFNFGIWDLVIHRADKLIEEKFPPFLDFIKSIRANPVTSSMRIIYVNTSPRRAGDTDANYYMIPAVNQFIQSKLKEVGIEIVDGFNIKNVMINTTCDSGHFLCTSSSAPARGRTGMIFAQLVFRLICKQNTK